MERTALMPESEEESKLRLRWWDPEPETQNLQCNGAEEAVEMSPFVPLHSEEELAEPPTRPVPGHQPLWILAKMPVVPGDLSSG